MGIGDRLLHGDSTVELPVVAVCGCGLLNSNIYGIRHSALTLQKHMTNINGGDYRFYNR